MYVPVFEVYGYIKVTICPQDFRSSIGPVMAFAKKLFIRCYLHLSCTQSSRGKHQYISSSIFKSLNFVLKFDVVGLVVKKIRNNNCVRSNFKGVRAVRTSYFSVLPTLSRLKGCAKPKVFFPKSKRGILVLICVKFVYNFKFD